MENFNQIFTLLAEEEGISLNLDILETGLLNILALLGILIYTGKDFLGSLLEERKTSIVTNVQDAEDRLNEAQKRLIDAQKQLDQANLVISEIKNETITTKKVLLKADSYEAKKDLKIRFERAFSTFQSKKRQIFLEIKQQIISLVLNRTISRAQETFGPKDRASALINDTIQKIGRRLIMSGNPLASKIAAPYARALFDFSVEKNIMHQITADFQNLEVFLNENEDLTNYFNNPIVSPDAKGEILTKTLKSQLNSETFKFLMILISRNRINLLKSIITNYLELVYKAASIKMIEVSTAYPFANLQKNTLIQKLKELTDAREIRLLITVDSSLIGGFLIKTESKIIDFTIKNQLQKLAKHLDTFIEI